MKYLKIAKTPISYKITSHENVNTLTTILYEHSSNQFIRLSVKISAEVVQDLLHKFIDIRQVNFSNKYRNLEMDPTDDEIIQIYQELLSKKNSGSSLRYKKSKLEDFEVIAFELLSEKLASYFRNEKLNSIGI